MKNIITFGSQASGCSFCSIEIGLELDPVSPLTTNEGNHRTVVTFNPAAFYTRSCVPWILDITKNRVDGQWAHQLRSTHQVYEAVVTNVHVVILILVIRSSTSS